MTERTPIRREISVAAEPAVAFRVFTEQIGSWWPLAEYSVHGAEASVAFVGRAIVETAAGQPDSVWGEVTDWNPPGSLSFTWHPGGAPDRASRVSVTFTPTGERTLVRLEHDGWERFEQPVRAREEYGHGWPVVLARYGALVDQATTLQAPADSDSDSGPDSDTEWTWAALLHRPGPAANGVQNIFADPRFGEHVAFLERMRAAGHLVAAGPLGDEPGAGMTVLRLPGADAMDDALRLATEDDRSVAGGFFSVTVRPWQVVLHR